MTGMISAAAFAAFCIVFNPASVFGGDLEEIQTRISDQASELKNLETELNSYREMLKNLSERESALLERNRVLEADLLRQQSRLETFAAERNLIERELRELETKLAEERGAETQAGIMLNQTASVYFRRKVLAETLPWYSYHIISEPPAPASGEVVRLTAAEYESLAEKAENTGQLKKEKEAGMKRLIALETEVASLQNNLIRKKMEQINLLEGIRKERETRERELEKLEEDKSRLSELLAGLRRRAVDIERLRLMAEDFIGAKGNLPYPVEGRIVSFFGKQRHPELDADIYNRGVVINGASGTPVAAAASGEVVFSGLLSGLKQVVVIDHGKDYYTLYGRLEKVKVAPGDEVEPPGIIGTLASEGLYFELGLGSTLLDPSEWLADYSGD